MLRRQRREKFSFLSACRSLYRMTRECRSVSIASMLQLPVAIRYRVTHHLTAHAPPALYYGQQTSGFPRTCPLFRTGRPFQGFSENLIVFHAGIRPAQQVPELSVIRC